MGENIVVNVEFEGTNMGTVNEIQVVPSDIAWEDLELMLKVYAGHDEGDQLLVKYRDDDHDEVTISTQEELQEAFKVAKRSNNTLQLRVLCDVTPDTGVQEGNVVVKANVMTQSVSMVTTDKQADGGGGAAPPDSQTGAAPDVVPVDDVEMRKDEDNEDVASVIMEEQEDKDGDDCLIVDVETGGERPTTSAAPVATPAKKTKRLFYIKNKISGHVLDINGGNPNPNTDVITWPRKPGNGPDNANQLWYWDNLLIRSALNDLCLDAEDTAFMKPVDPGRPSQQWKVTDGKIHRHGNHGCVLTAWNNMAGQSVSAEDIPARSQDAEWETEYLEQGKKKVCTNKETGEHVQCGPNRGCRPKAAKRGKKDHYAELAKEVGREIFNKGAGNAQPSPKKRVPAGASAPGAEDSPPTWFFKYMDKFKKEITDDMAKLVARKTVHQVLRGLNNAVIDTVKVTKGGQIVHEGPSGATQQKSDPEGYEEARYCHDGVVCDHCENVIVGVRYKCGNCDDFDLCEKCEDAGNAHDPEHVFLKIRRPVQTASRTRASRMLPLLKTNLYKARDDKMFEEKPQKEEKIRRKSEKLREKCEKFEEKMRRKEEKLKRRLESSKETPQKKEKLDLPKAQGQIDLEFLSDETIPDGTHVQPSTRLNKKWLVKNTGMVQWDKNCELAMMWGNMNPVRSEVAVPSLLPEEEGIVAVEILAPADPGIYQSHWRLSYQGRRYGHRVWCSIVVDPKETLEPISEDTTMLNVSGDDLPKDAPQTPAPIITMETKAASEPPTPAPREGKDSHTDLYHIMSYETLDISNRPRAKASQTATPNNTPRDVTPPKSPVTELRGLSTSSSVEVVAMDPDDEGVDEETMSRMTELVQERMASLGLKPSDRDDDLDSWSSYEEGLSDDTDSDFYVVPIPDCFNPELPPASSASTSVYVKKDEMKSIDEILTTSHSLETEPLLTPSTTEVTVPDPSPPPARGATSEVRDASTYEPIQGNTDDADGDDDDVIVVRVELPGDGSDRGTVPKELVTDGAVGGQEEGGATGGVDLIVDDDDEETDQNANLPLDINDNSAGTPNQEGSVSPQPQEEEPREGSASPQPQGEVSGATQAEGDDPREISPSPGELASQVVSAARGVASIATHAAQSAYSTAKDVFHTLQAKDRYVPASSNWEPSKEEWTPPKEEWTPPIQTWTPPEESEPTRQCRPQTHMDQLIEMGFANREQNKRLLRIYDDDVDKVVGALLQQENDDWPTQRH